MAEASKRSHAQKEKRLTQLKKDSSLFSEELDKFSVNLNKEHFEKALKLFNKLKANKDGFKTPTFKVNVVKVFKG